MTKYAGSHIFKKARARSSGSVAYKGLPVLEVELQIVSIVLIGIPAINHGAMSVAARTTLVSMAVICFVDSR